MKKQIRYATCLGIVLFLFGYAGLVNASQTQTCIILKEDNLIVCSSRPNYSTYQTTSDNGNNSDSSDTSDNYNSEKPYYSNKNSTFFYKPAY